MILISERAVTMTRVFNHFVEQAEWDCLCPLWQERNFIGYSRQLIFKSFWGR